MALVLFRRIESVPSLLHLSARHRVVWHRPQSGQQAARSMYAVHTLRSCFNLLFTVRNGFFFSITVIGAGRIIFPDDDYFVMLLHHGITLTQYARGSNALRVLSFAAGVVGSFIMLCLFKNLSLRFSISVSKLKLWSTMLVRHLCRCFSMTCHQVNMLYSGVPDTGKTGTEERSNIPLPTRNLQSLKSGVETAAPHNATTSKASFCASISLNFLIIILLE
jgi:hypothetical protein